jgi:hypothetical protein
VTEKRNCEHKKETKEQTKIQVLCCILTHIHFVLCNSYVAMKFNFAHSYSHYIRSNFDYIEAFGAKGSFKYFEIHCNYILLIIVMQTSIPACTVFLLSN